MEFGTYIEYLAIILLVVWCLYRLLCGLRISSARHYTGKDSKELVLQILKDWNCTYKIKDGIISFYWRFPGGGMPP